MRLKPIQIADKIKELSGINIFENTRKRPVVEMRSLLCYLLREKLGMRWTNIALFFKSQGKPVNHATVIHSKNLYEIYKKTNKKLAEIEKLFSFKSSLTIDEIDRVHYLENKCKNLQLKLENPLVKLLDQIPEEKHDKAVNDIERLIKSWEWKEKVL
nr:hypothetical protein [uncultured Mediterranean phage uvMED]|tara:strand:- start:93 stop:563 length:471 start_codon:yes stop_codon:yes gene_type:complete